MGELSGPRLQQGMVICQGGRTLYINGAFGPLPHNETLVTSTGTRLPSKREVPLVIPRQYIDKSGPHLLPTSRFSCAESDAYLELVNLYAPALNQV